MEYLLSVQAASGFTYQPVTGSSNKDLLEKAKAEDLPEFYVMATDYQLAGRGRLERRWEAAPGSSVMASILLRPDFRDPNALGWLSLLAAIAIAQSLKELEIQAQIKWPNDVLIADKKVSGILAEASQDLSSVVVGFGINVLQQPNQLPFETATSLLAATGNLFDRDQILASVITNLRALYLALAETGGDALQSGIRELALDFSATTGKKVRIIYPDESEATGEAIDIDHSGRLVVRTSKETLSVSAGDVLHLRSL